MVRLPPPELYDTFGPPPANSQLKGKIVSELFHTFSEFFPQDFPLQNKGF